MTDPQPTGFLVGIDAGGTHTLAMAASTEGDEFRWAEGGAGNYQILGLDGVLSLLTDLIRRLDVDPACTTLCAALAGAGRTPEQKTLSARLKEEGLASSVSVVADARAALEGAHGGEEGIIAIAGTGSIVMGRSAAGDVCRAGGWGPLLGDEASAYSIVMGGLRAAGQAHDGSGPPTQLKQALLESLEIGAWDELIPALYGDELPRERLAAACPTVFRVARDGDDVARAVIARQSGRLGAQIRAVAVGLELAPASVALMGGLGEAEGDWLWEALQSEPEGPPVELIRVSPRLPPVAGALLMAFSQAGLDRPDITGADCEPC